MRAVTDRKRGGLGCGAWAGIGLVASCCVITGIGVAGSDAVATSVIRDRLVEQGITCDERFAVDVGWTLDSASLAPTRCTITSREIEAIELLDPAVIELGEGFEPSAVRGGRARIDMRAELPSLRAGGVG